MDIIIYIAAFVGVASLVGGLAFILRPPVDTQVEDRLAMLTGSGSKSGKDGVLSGGSVLSHPLESTQNLAEAVVSRFLNVPLLLEQANLRTPPSRFLAICAIFGAIGAITPAVFGLHIAIWPATGLAMAYLPIFAVIFLKKRRFAAFGKQLPDALELMGRALRAGHSLGSGFHLVSEEMNAPISVEFQRVFEEQNLGIAMDDSLNNMTGRIPNLDLRFFATAVILQRQTGGDLAEILDKIGYIIRERFKILGQVQALTGEGRLSGVVLLALPPLLFVAVYRLNPEYVMPLFTDPMGRKMLAGGVVMQLLGALVIRKIINIKV